MRNKEYGIFYELSPWAIITAAFLEKLSSLLISDL
jgi:hypothetical protein